MSDKNFRFGDGMLHLECDEPQCRELITDLYRECLVGEVNEPWPSVRCIVRSEGGQGDTRVSFQGIEAFDIAGFALSLFDQMDCRRVEAPGPGWEAVESRTQPGMMACSGTEIIAGAGSPWRWLVAMLALHLVIRKQPDVFFFHAGSVSINGNGLLIVGPTNSGKTTLALALADRGHAFLGDDYAALRMRSNELLPMRRRLSIRTGPCAPGIREALNRREWPTRTLADGSIRYLVHAATLFPTSVPAPAPLRSILFLGDRGEEPMLEPIPASQRPLNRLTPFAGTFESAPPGAVALGMAKLITRVPSFVLRLGSIPETVRLVENLWEN